MRIVIIHV